MPHFATASRAVRGLLRRGLRPRTPRSRCAGPRMPHFATASRAVRGLLRRGCAPETPRGPPAIPQPPPRPMLRARHARRPRCANRPAKMRRERNAVQRAVVLVLAIFAVGTVGYRLIEGASWWDAFFMTIITVTTVGFSEEIPLSEIGKLFTAFLLLAGFGLILFLVTETSRSVLEGELRRFLGRVRRSRMIDRMSGHEIDSTNSAADGSHEET